MLLETMYVACFLQAISIDCESEDIVKNSYKKASLWLLKRHGLYVHKAEYI